MPKLVIKQDLPEPSTQEKLEGALRLILPVLLLVVTAAVALSLYLAREPEPLERVAAPAYGFDIPPVYKRQAERLAALEHAFETQEKEGLEGYDKHSALVGKSDEILQQLSEMDGIVEGLGIAAKDKQSLLARHQYQQDYWEAKRVFHDLRLTRFAADGQKQQAVLPGNEAAAAPAKTEPAKNVTTSNGVQPVAANAGESAPPAELPADFCPLFGPGAAACKPGADGKKP